MRIGIVTLMNFIFAGTCATGATGNSMSGPSDTSNQDNLNNDVNTSIKILVDSNERLNFEMSQIKSILQETSKKLGLSNGSSQNNFQQNDQTNTPLNQNTQSNSDGMQKYAEFMSGILTACGNCHFCKEKKPCPVKMFMNMISHVEKNDLHKNLNAQNVSPQDFHILAMLKNLSENPCNDPSQQCILCYKLLNNPRIGGILSEINLLFLDYHLNSMRNPFGPMMMPFNQGTAPNYGAMPFGYGGIPNYGAMPFGYGGIPNYGAMPFVNPFSNPFANPFVQPQPEASSSDKTTVYDA